MNGTWVHCSQLTCQQLRAEPKKKKKKRRTQNTNTKVMFGNNFCFLFSKNFFLGI